jgi:hypothetical protein
MQFNRSSPDNASNATVLALRPAAVSIRSRRNLNQMGWLYGRTRTVRKLVKDDLCASTLNLVRLPAIAARGSMRILVCPGERLVDTTGHLAWASPSAYVIHENRELKLLRDESLCATRTPFQLNLTVLQDALTSAQGFQPVAKAHLNALEFGGLVRGLLATRQAVWEHHVRRLQVSPDTCRHIEIIARARRYLIEVTHRVIEPLLAEIRDSEWSLIKAFLAPLNERPARRTRRRPTSLERQRNRCQALETYPFLESIWPSDDKTPTPTSLMSALSPRELRTIRRVIDEGQPLSSLLERKLGLEPWMIEHLRRHWPAYLPFERVHYDDHRWNLGAMLSLWTPETAPQNREELLALYLLIYARDGVAHLPQHELADFE